MKNNLLALNYKDESSGALSRVQIFFRRFAVDIDGFFRIIELIAMVRYFSYIGASKCEVTVTVFHSRLFHL